MIRLSNKLPVMLDEHDKPRDAVCAEQLRGVLAVILKREEHGDIHFLDFFQHADSYL